MQLFQFQMSKFRLNPKYIESFGKALLESTHAHLRSLYDELIAPIRDQLTTEHLVVVQHGLLHYVPFHALHDGKSFMIDHFSTSYAPSASVYALCQEKRISAGENTLIFGVPDAKAPLIEAEVRALAAMLPNAQLFVGEDATERVLRDEGTRSRMLHIATHGYFRQDNPMFSSIRLGDSHLSLYDLYKLRLSAELVVLSGCSTGLNLVTPGDELIGLARGFLQAGARSLMLSLWDVHDESTKDFMISFYAHLRKGQSKAQATRSAMIELRGKYPHPYHWAPFSLIGKG
jgi:CHAT domain-containing protein